MKIFRKSYYSTIYQQENHVCQKILNSLDEKRLEYFPMQNRFDNFFQTMKYYMVNSKVKKFNDMFHYQYIKLSDGGKIRLDWNYDHKSKIDKPIVMLFVGINGVSCSYIPVFKYITQTLGWNCIIYNRRGCNIKLETTTFNILGNAHDVHEIMQHLSFEINLSKAPLYAIGWSAGSCELFNYLVKYPYNHFKGCTFISPGYDVKVASQQIKWPYTKILSTFCVNSYIKNNIELWNSHPNIDKILNSQSILEFIDYTHSMMGAQSTDDYFDKHNVIKNIHEIKIPILVLSALNDPIFQKDLVYDQFSDCFDAENIILIMTQFGGHCYFHQNWQDEHSWSDQISLDFFHAIEENELNYSTFSNKSQCVGDNV
tara:strand:+ start:2922 stop:4031 length:1110 start_codon:yes stop_codon:yes gene_type:complete